MQTILTRASMDSTRLLDRPRTAMDCITNTHHQNHTPQKRSTTDKKRRLSINRNSIVERLSLDSRTSLSYIPSTSSKRTKDNTTQVTFADSVRSSLVKKGYNDVLSTDPPKAGLLQFRRKAVSDSKQFYPLQITIPPPTTLVELAGRFENPRKAPIPQGPRYSSTNAKDDTQLSALLEITPAGGLSATATEFSNLTNASVFALPKFNPEKEMRILQNLWTKRSLEIGDSPPLIHRSSFTAPSTHIPEEQIVPEVNVERSYFESDTETEDENDSMKRKAWMLRPRSKSSFSALRRAFTSPDRIGLKHIPSVDDSVRPDEWRKTFSLCDCEGDRWLVMQTSTENGMELVAATIPGLAFELFKSQSEDVKKFLVRCHSMVTTTGRVLDVIQGCLLNEESQLYWQSSENAVLRILETLEMWYLIRPDDLMETMRKQQVNDILKWCSNHLSEETQSLYNSVVKHFSTEIYAQPPMRWLTKPIMESGKRNHLLNLKGKEIAHYLATYDLIYITHILEKTTLTTLIPQIANDEISIFTTPDLRTEQLQYWVTMSILNSSNMSLRIRWICLFIETCLVLVELGDLFSATLIGNALLSPEIQNLTSTWRKIPPELVASLARLMEICHSCQTWESHLQFLQVELEKPWIPYLPCILREIRNINTTQPTYVKYYEGLTDDPILIPASEATGMINLRKLRKMYDTLMQAAEHINHPYSFWGRILPEDSKTSDEGGEMKVLEELEGVKNLVEREIEGYWNDQMSAEGMNANWERRLQVKKILASAGF